MKEIDFSDSQELWKFGCETIELAEKHLEAREKYAFAIKEFKLELAKAYGKGTVKEGLSEEKAYILLAKDSEKLKQLLVDTVETLHLYKGLDRVLDARKALINLSQSIIKNQPK